MSVASIINIKIKPEYTEVFKKASHKNAEATRKEAGCIRFDILQSSNDGSDFVFYEVFDSEAAKEAHKKTAHVSAWKLITADMIVAKSSVVYHVIPDLRSLSRTPMRGNP